ncbi:hypothetical protein GS982_19900 [Rhodococcus hoagii]|nr:hypothetical protein [Prescottella equi]NKZ84467.1 hypothetical protein [Prescottella equi]
MSEPVDERFDADTRIELEFQALEEALARSIANPDRPFPEMHAGSTSRCMVEDGDLVLEVSTDRPVGGEWTPPQRRVLDGRSLFDEMMFSEPD